MHPSVKNLSGALRSCSFLLVGGQEWMESSDIHSFIFFTYFSGWLCMFNVSGLGTRLSEY